MQVQALSEAVACVTRNAQSFQYSRKIRNDKHIIPKVRGNPAAGGKQWPEQWQHFRSRCITQTIGARGYGSGIQSSLREAKTFLGSVRGVCQGHHGHNIAFALPDQAIGVQDCVQRLLGRNVAQSCGHAAMNVGSHHNAESAGLLDEAKEIHQVQVCHIERNVGGLLRRRSLRQTHASAQEEERNSDDEAPGHNIFYANSDAAWPSSGADLSATMARLGMREAAQTRPAKPEFSGLRVLSLESRRSEELARLIRNYGGVPILAPSMREVPLKDNQEALNLISELMAGRVSVLILLTGVGTRVLLRVAEDSQKQQFPRFLEALQSVCTVARDGKAAAALGEAGVRATLTASEPNTWREVLQSLDANAGTIPLKGRTVAVQEYGLSNYELLNALAERGARVMRVPVYDWQLPEDVGPLREAVRKLASGEVDIVLFTTSVQVRHLMQIATEMNLPDAVRRACSKVVVGSIGPVTSEELRTHQFPVDLEPSHPRMGFLVNEMAQRCQEILAAKRQS